MNSLSYELILLIQGRYIRMDRFQEDMFKVFERARRLSRTDSQVSTLAVFKISKKIGYFIKIKEGFVFNK